MPYRFKKEYRDSVISIPVLRLNLSRFNITDELVSKILKKFPQFAHNFEFVDLAKEPDDRFTKESFSFSELEEPSIESDELEEPSIELQSPKPKAKGKLNKGKSKGKNKKS